MRSSTVSSRQGCVERTAEDKATFTPEPSLALHGTAPPGRRYAAVLQIYGCYAH